MNSVFTIGHSTHNAEEFLNLLKAHRISAIGDVRSSPYSKFNPQYNREELHAFLKQNGIAYVFLGKELGARSEDPCCYEDGKVRYRKLAQTALFKAGLDRVKKGSEKFNLALMCSEKEPLDCHRTILISRELEDNGMTVSHILEDGRLEPHKETIQRLMKQMNMGGDDLFLSPEEIEEQAYQKQEKQIAYTQNQSDAERES